MSCELFLLIALGKKSLGGAYRTVALIDKTDMMDLFLIAT